MLRTPVIMMVLAATAIPIELRPWSLATLDLSSSDWLDIVENIAGYVPVGIVLGGLGPLRAVTAAALISMFAETSQFMMAHRDPSAIDVASNVIGAILGAFISAQWRIRSAWFPVNTRTALTAAAIAFCVLLAVWGNSGAPYNTRGATSPGTLDAYWKFDDSGLYEAMDSSGHGHHGRLHNQAKYVDGVRRTAISLDGAKDYIDFGHSSAFRLIGSMTVSAWIKSTSFPDDDAAIVSTYDGLGYQLDITGDRGPRTIGFKLADACGNLMARYGATSLVTGTWYYVTGVYNAEAQTLDVYLNGELDNGFLRGSVTETQRSSRMAVYVGRRGDHRGFEFAGSIDDVRIYSRALTQAAIAADMNGTGRGVVEIQHTTAERNYSSRSAEGRRSLDIQCTSSDPDDARIPGAAAVVGVLVAVACVGFRPAFASVTYLVISFAAGLFFVPATAPTLPSLSRWLLPVISLAGGVSVVISVYRHDRPDHY